MLDSTKRFPLGIFLSICLVLLLLGLSWTLEGVQPLTEQSGLRMVVGAFLVFLLPGMLWNEIFDFQSIHPLETISIGFATSLCLALLSLPVLLTFELTIAAWVYALYGISFVGVILVFFKQRAGHQSKFLQPLVGLFGPDYAYRTSGLFALGLLIVAGYITFQWGEDDLRSIGFEKILHLSFIRLYFSLPLNLPDLGQIKGSLPANLIHLWEFLIAGWARLINMDPLALFYHARFVIPVLGISSMYVLVRGIFWERNKTEAIFWGVIVLSAGTFVLQTPSSLSWFLAIDSTRLLTSYMGTAHHSDAAMEILLPLGSGIVLYALRLGHLRYFILLFGVLAATFLWHPREFFQIGIYFGLASIVLFAWHRGFGRSNMLRRWGMVALFFISTALLFFVLIKILVPVDSMAHGYDELKIKAAAVSYALNWDSLFGVRNLFNFPLHFTMSSSASPDQIFSYDEIRKQLYGTWHYDLWLLISSVAVMFVGLFGSTVERRFVTFFVLLWFVLFSWNFSMPLIIAATYSEILITIPRFLYIFAPLVVSTAFYVTSKKIFQSERRYLGTVIFFGCVFAMGILFRLWADAGYPKVNIVATVLSFSILGLIIVMSGLWLRSAEEDNAENIPVFLPVLAVILFSVPILKENYFRYVSSEIYDTRSDITPFGPDNTFGYSEQLLDLLKTIKPGSTFTIDPVGILSPHFQPVSVSIYSPLHQPLFFSHTAINTISERELLTNSKHPLFNLNEFVGEEIRHDEGIDFRFSDLEGIKVAVIGAETIPVLMEKTGAHKRIRSWITANQSEFILIRQKYFSELMWYFQAFPEDYKQIFINYKDKEAVYAVR